jgi:hypothetical protein
MKQYIIIIIIITICVFVFSTSYRSTIEGATTSSIPDSSQIVINNSESLRDFLGSMRYICNLDENTIKDNIKPSVCYKINKLYGYFYPVKDFLDNKTEDEIMAAYGPQEQPEIAGQKVGTPQAIPIINSNHDYNVLILLVSYIKMLQPYNDLDIWVQNDNNNPPSITSHCNYNDNDSVQFVKCAKEMLDKIKICLSYFQYQTDISNIVAYGDGSDTGTGDVPK